MLKMGGHSVKGRAFGVRRLVAAFLVGAFVPAKAESDTSSVSRDLGGRRRGGFGFGSSIIQLLFGVEILYQYIIEVSALASRENADLKALTSKQL